MNELKELQKMFNRIEIVFGKEKLQVFMNCDYREVTDNYHFGFGTWIRNNILIEGNVIYKSFVSMGIEQGDDISTILIFMFYLYIKNKYNSK